METTIGNAVEAYVNKVSESKYFKKRQKDAVKNLLQGNSKKIVSKEKESTRDKDFVFLHQDQLNAKMKITHQEAVDDISEAVKNSLMSYSRDKKSAIAIYKEFLDL